MIAAFMFGRITLRSTCAPVAPSTRAASSSSPGTCASPESSSREMNGVVFQISEAMITNMDVPWAANQFRSSVIPGTQENQLLMRSEERRVGKACRYRRAAGDIKKKAREEQRSRGEDTT